MGDQVGSRTKDVIKEIDVLIRARYPILYLLTHEETRVEAMLFQIASKQGKQLLTWSAARGLVQYLGENGIAPRKVADHTDPNDVLNYIQEKDAPGLYLLKDFHPFLDDPQITRRLRDLSPHLKGSLRNILIVAPRLNLPAELEKEITLIDVPLPDAHELMDLLKSVVKAIANRKNTKVNLSNDDAVALVRAAQGLTLSEAENAFAKAIVTDTVFDKNDIALVLQEKAQIIRKSGMLEFYPIDQNFGDVGGLEELKSWLQIRGKGRGEKAAGFGLSAPKGVLLLGAPGCGKSLTAKAVANAWQLPLLRLDLGRIFSGLVGSSEENMRNALKVAEGVAPSVLWIDEIEKGLAGNGSGGSDGGTASRVFGTFLTWMQEKKSDVFVVATANRIDLLPPELLRRGRFDEIFFLDLPSTESRLSIATIHIKKRGRDPKAFNLRALASATEGFSGAEIEHCVMEGLFTAFDAGRELTTDDLLKAADHTVPLSVTYAEELKRTREWASLRARNAEKPADSVNTVVGSRWLKVANEK